MLILYELVTMDLQDISEESWFEDFSLDGDDIHVEEETVMEKTPTQASEEDALEDPYDIDEPGKVL